IALENVLELYEGLAEAGTPVLGGDTTSADKLMLSVTAIGRSDRVPGRDGARVGDVLVITGPLGASGAVFREERFVRPPVRITEGRQLARHAHAMIDISDGLAVDAAHLARRSRCRVEIELDRVPLADGATLDDLGFGDRVPLADGATLDDLGFGEDYELLAAVEEPGRFTAIGRCVEGEGVAFTYRGRPYE